MKYKLLVSGERDNFTTLEFDPASKQLVVLADYPAPFNSSWIERSSSHGEIEYLIGVSEGEESGSLYTFEIDHAGKSCKITSQQPTLGAPCHFMTLEDRSAIAVGTYMGGAISIYPVSTTARDGLLLTDASRTEVIPEFPYKSAGHGPSKNRQEFCHVHQILEDKRGFLYALDLGSDRIWIFRRDGLKIESCGWLQCPPGTGPRHAAMNPSETIMYVVGELSHKVIAFDLSVALSEGMPPMDGFSPSMISPKVQSNHQTLMDAGEICVHPITPNVLYVSNRWERHIARLQPELTDVPKELPPGDSVAIILLSADGKAVDKVTHVQTNVDVIRGMRLSPDGKYAVVVGQEGGGMEIYEISGERGEIWTLAVGLSKGVEGSLKHAIWL